MKLRFVIPMALAALTTVVTVIPATAATKTFHNVSLATICQYSERTPHGACLNGWVNIGDTPFKYQMVDRNPPPPWVAGEAPVLNFPVSSCRSLTLHLAVEGAAGSAGVVVLRPGSGVSVSYFRYTGEMPQGHIRTVTWELPQGPFKVTDWATGVDVIFYSGTFSCSTDSGV